MARSTSSIQPGVARREDRVATAAARAGRLVHLGARVELHLVGQEPVARLLRRRAADQRHLGVAVEIDLLEPVRILQVLDRLRLADEAGIPAGLADRLASAHETFEPRVVAQEVRVHVHDELVFQPVGARLGEIDALRLGRRGAVERAIDLVHGDEGRRHAGGGLEEAAAGQACSCAELVAEPLHARLDLLLLPVCGIGQELVARDDLRRHRRREGRRFRGQQIHGDLLGRAAYFIGENAVGRRIMLRTCCTIGPFFSLSANTRARSGSLANVSRPFMRSSRLSQASR